MAPPRSSAWSVTDLANTPQRIALLDAARGAAVVAMVAYHVTWDLSFFGVISPATHTARWFAWTGTIIASGFLFLSGFALVVFRRNITLQNAFYTRFFKRLAVIGVAALAVSIGTYFAMGERWVRFGILHCIAVSSLVALPFLRRSCFAALGVALAALMLPLVVTGGTFNHPALLWLGLAEFPPASVDHVPLFPYLGALLLGVAAAQLIPVSAPAANTPSPLAYLGRWSLPIYLIHQPLLFGAFYLLLGGLPTQQPSPTLQSGYEDTDTQGFRRECRAVCIKQPASTEAICTNYCDCAETEFRQSGLWIMLMTRAPTSDEQSRVAEVTQSCTAKARN
jgi:uncharacterized membrane protein